MYIHSVSLENFKSIGHYPENEIIVEPRITAIIGKNESGKSNVLEGLSLIDFRKANSAAFSEDIKNRIASSTGEVKYTILLKPNDTDKEKGLLEEACVVITKDKAEIFGGLKDLFLSKIHPAFEALVSFLDGVSTNPFNYQSGDYTAYKNNKNSLVGTDHLLPYSIAQVLNYLDNRINSFPSEKRDEYRTSVEQAKEKWESFMQMLPTFFFRRADKHLLPKYVYEDIKKELNGQSGQNSLLREFVKLTGISAENFLIAAQSGTTASQLTLRRRIQQAIDKNINQEFHEFYKTESVSLYIDFNSGMITFTVQSSDGEALMLSERSNGLRWYLETFIDARAHDVADTNVVYLFDEPGVSLHVNAQRELLNLFSHLASQGNQVVYSTHSPYMLDMEQEGIHRIRAVTKDNEGYTYIYKTAYDARISPESQEDTFAPIINALGMNLQHTFGPAMNKINIVPEGMSDYIFLCTFAKLLSIDFAHFAIIPSIGVTNTINICTILQGWGCKYIALFDYDKQGVEKGGEFLRKNFFFEEGKQFCYVRDVGDMEIADKTYETSPFAIEEVVTQREIARFRAETNTPILGKPLTAKKMCTAIEDGSFMPNDQCITNFRELFNRIISYTT